jgi:hypothetical protein
MKNYTLIVLTLMIISCNESEIPIDKVIFYGSANIPTNNDTLNYKQSLMLVYDRADTFSLGFIYFVGESIRRKHLSIIGFTMSFKKQKLFTNDNDYNFNMKPYSSFETLLFDGDVAGNYYKLNSSDSIEDYIQIKEYNPITKMVRGNVQASYIIDLFPLGIKQDLTSPDTIVIRDFQFETKILER